MSLNFSSPLALTGSILDQVEYDDCMDLRIDPAYTGYVQGTFWFGGWGYLPLAGRSTGDLIALYAVPGVPLQEWSVVELPHNGEGGNSYASTIHSFASLFVARSGIHYSDDLEHERKVFTLLAKILGDERIEQVFAAIEATDRDEFLRKDEAFLHRLAEGDTALTRFYDTYNQIYTSQSPDPVSEWEKFITRDPHIAPAWHLLFGGLRKTAHKKRAAEAAFAVCSQDYMNDNYWAFDACKAFGSTCGIAVTDEAREFLLEEDVSVEAARYLVTESKHHDYNKAEIWPAIVSMANEDLVGNIWLDCAKNLESAGKYRQAYFAYHTANRHYSSETEESEMETVHGALRCVEALGDANIIELLEAVKPDGDRGDSEED